MIAEIKGIPFTLLTEKALYKQDERLLIIADVHLGKANHFRKEGIAIPAGSQLGDYIQLEKLFCKIAPLKVYFLGDLFHSSFNRDWHYFSNLVTQFPAISFTLVRGNHDIINDELFNDIGVSVTDAIEDEYFIYSHEPLPEVNEKKVNITGHVHPGITLTGIGRQSIKLPCFYITEQLVVLPAFGMLTGLYNMGRNGNAQIYGILPGEIRRIM